MSSAVRDAVMCAWECALSGTSVTYLSGPVTTGPRLVKALQAGEAVDQRAIIIANGAALREAATQLRLGGCLVVVEPASLTLPGWTQSAYIQLWADFIGRFARETRFMPGWEFSAGCAAEFARATELGLPTLSLGGNEISPQLGRSLLVTALTEIRGLGPEQSLARMTLAITEALGRLSRLASADL
jgi:hypothetical protein